MSGLMGKASVPKVPQSTLDAQKRAEEKAEAQEKDAMSQIEARKRVRRTGGLRMLLSPSRSEGETEKTTLGS
tara:strand:+ start:2161 stop:2376 length:216 start_codon:yes stop_codon:yes gene_type:complete